jgi:hypothetical protein
MRVRRPLVAVAIAALTTLGGATVASAHTLVDPTTLTPPLLPFRVCYEDGPWVKSDTSGTDTTENEPVFELPCGTIYETATVISHATRWYENGLPVERNATQRIRGTWSLSPTGAAPNGRDRRGRWLARNVPRARRHLERFRGRPRRFPPHLGHGRRLPRRWHLPARRHASSLASFTDEATTSLCALLTP